jgi:hypothetical protein
MSQRETSRINNYIGAITMKVTNVTEDKVECVLTKDEILMIKNCVGETCFGFRLQDFHSKIGFKKEEVSDFAEQVYRIINELEIEE